MWLLLRCGQAVWCSWQLRAGVLIYKLRGWMAEMSASCFTATVFTFKNLSLIWGGLHQDKRVTPSVRLSVVWYQQLNRSSILIKLVHTSLSGAVSERPSLFPPAKPDFFFFLIRHTEPAHSVAEQVLVLCKSAQRSCTFLLCGKWNYICSCIEKPLDNSII